MNDLEDSQDDPVEVEPHYPDVDAINKELEAVAFKHGLSRWMFVAETQTDTHSAHRYWANTNYSACLGMLIRTMDKIRGIGQ